MAMKKNTQMNWLALNTGAIPEDMKALRLGFFEHLRLKIEARGEVTGGSVAIGEDGRYDSPRLRDEMDRAAELKALYFEDCAKRTAEARHMLPSDETELERLEEKAKAIADEIGSILVPEPKAKSEMSADEIVDIRRLRRELAGKQADLAAAKADIERIRHGIDEALKLIRQTEEETILAVCAVETRAHKKMNAYIDAASRKAGIHFSILAPQEDLFPKVAEELYAFLNRNEQLPARALYPKAAGKLQS
jgi:hypothetical protein